jgi:hypothetical protein
LSFWFSYERISVQSTKVIMMKYVGEHIKDLVGSCMFMGKVWTGGGKGSLVGYVYEGKKGKDLASLDRSIKL